MAAAFGGERAAVVARELTKVHETFYRGSLAQLLQRAHREENFARGEITVVVHGAPEDAGDAVDEAQLRRTVEVLLKELPPGRAAALAAQLTGASRASAYALALKRGPAAAEPESAP
jgi:16S rRNA (cytidine1402-2'-O)-methyltransferase